MENNASSDDGLLFLLLVCQKLYKLVYVCQTLGMQRWVIFETVFLALMVQAKCTVVVKLKDGIIIQYPLCRLMQS